MAAAERIRLGGDEVVVRVTSAGSGGGELAIYRADGDGTLERTPAGPGDVVHIPGGREHTVRNESAAEAAAYVTFTPGAPMEGFIRAAAALGDAPMERCSPWPRATA